LHGKLFISLKQSFFSIIGHSVTLKVITSSRQRMGKAFDSGRF
jgi:hypothetical protein